MIESDRQTVLQQRRMTVMINSSLLQLTYRRTGHIAHVVFDFCYHLSRLHVIHPRPLKAIKCRIWSSSSAWDVKWGEDSTTFGGGASEIPIAASAALSPMAYEKPKTKVESRDVFGCVF